MINKRFSSRRRSRSGLARRRVRFVASGAVLAVGFALSPLGAAPAAKAASDPSLIAYSTQIGGIWVVQAGHPKSAKLIGPGGAPSWSPNGETLAYTTNSAIVLIDRAGTVVDSLKAPVAGGLSWSPNGKEIAYLCDRGHILSVQGPSPTPPVEFPPQTWPNLCVINVVTGEDEVVAQSTLTDAVLGAVSWSQTGNDIAVDSQTAINTSEFCVNYILSPTITGDPKGPGCQEPHISLVDPKTGSIEPIGKEFMGEPAFSPNGREIAFQDESDGHNQQLAVMSASGGDVRDILTLYKNANSASHIIPPSPSWSPNSKQLVFASYKLHSGSGSEGLYTIDAKGGHAKPATTFSIYATQWAGSPSWVQPVTRCTVPKLKGQKLADAKRLVALSGCTVGKVTGPKKDRAKRKVVKQKPAAGTKVATGTKVTMHLH